MRFSLASSLAAFTVATLTVTPAPVAADEFPVVFAFTLDHDFNPITDEHLAILSEAIVESCNDSHDKGQLHLDSAKIEKVVTFPDPEGLAAAVTNPLGVEGKSNWGGYIEGKGSGSCGTLCGDDDDSLGNSNLSDPSIEKWIKSLCKFLGNTNLFAGAKNCFVDFHSHGEMVSVYDADAAADTEGAAEGEMDISSHEVLLRGSGTNV